MSLLEVQNLGVSFRMEESDIEAVRGISLCIEKGETVALVGESGSGKTTLAMGLLRLEASQGPIRFAGADIQDKNLSLIHI